MNTIFHLDMDAFYASIEQRDKPSLKGKPVIIGAKPGTRGVVSAASYEARKFGVYSAMPISTAFRLCPKGVYLRPRIDYYLTISRKIRRVLDNYSPRIEPLSIDEAFLDMTGTEKLFGEPLRAAEKIQNEISRHLNLPCSIGIAPNKFLAKLSSDLNKPNGITTTPFSQPEITRWLSPFGIEKIWGVGKKTQAFLHHKGIRTIGDLQGKQQLQLCQWFGNSGISLYALSRGEDSREVSDIHISKSISREHTFAVDCPDREQWKRVLLQLSREIAQQARKEGLSGKTITLVFRTINFRKFNKQRTLENSTCSTAALFHSAFQLLETHCSTLSALRLIGIRLSGFEENFQESIWEVVPTWNKWIDSERAMDQVSQKFGAGSISFGGEYPGRKGDSTSSK